MSSSTPLRAAIVGLSQIGAGPARVAPDPALGDLTPHSHAAAYAAVPSTTVVAACDVDAAAIERFRQTWQPHFAEARCYRDVGEMLAHESIDLLSVATPDHLHADIVVAAAEAGVRGMLCEKPMATSLADCDRMLAACRARGIPLVINTHRRWYPEFAEARRLIRDGAIGQLRRIVANHGGARAMLFRNAPHLVDLVCYFAESEPAWVVAELEDDQRAYGPRYRGDGGRDPSTDPGGSGYIHFQNGVRAFVDVSKQSLPTFDLDLIGETGRIRIGTSGRIWIRTHVAEIARLLDNGELAVSQLPAPHTQRVGMVAAVHELVELVGCGARGGTSTGEDGRRAVSIILAMLQSSAANSTRVVFPIQDR